MCILPRPSFRQLDRQFIHRAAARHGMAGSASRHSSSEREESGGACCLLTEGDTRWLLGLGDIGCLYFWSGLFSSPVSATIHPVIFTVDIARASLFPAVTTRTHMKFSAGFFPVWRFLT
ncbi:hypothetical protein BsWGS_13226 [Bradybaena similaris]